jgi:SAM-dependent methyltransferase
VSPSASITNPTYWWYRARSDILRTVFEPHVPAGRLLDVGSADGPSVAWLDEIADRLPLDIDPTGLAPGAVCGSLETLPFADRSFDGVAAFDVIEHMAHDGAALREILRVLKPGGVLMATVPGYQWAWTDFDTNQGHHRRYTRRRFTTLLEGEGMTSLRATYAFTATFPLFALDRLAARAGLRGYEDPVKSTLPAWLERTLLMLGGWDNQWLRRADLPFGSSILVVARKVVRPDPDPPGGWK